MIFIDELGVNATVEDGLPLMWSICEYLLSVNNIATMIATHNYYLNELNDMYLTVNLLEFFVPKFI